LIRTNNKNKYFLAQPSKCAVEKTKIKSKIKKFVVVEYFTIISNIYSNTQTH
jgi:hypothetical protein